MKRRAFLGALGALMLPIPDADGAVCAVAGETRLSPEEEERVVLDAVRQVREAMREALSRHVGKSCSREDLRAVGVDALSATFEPPEAYTVYVSVVDCVPSDCIRFDISIDGDRSG